MTTQDTNNIDVELLRRTIAAGGSPDDIALFVEQIKRTGLDPFNRQILFVLRRTKDARGEWVAKGNVMISIDGARLVAARTGLYNGSDTWWCGTDGEWHDVWLGDGPPTAAKTTVMRSTARFTGVALWREYGANAYGPLWKTMGAHLLGKCSEMLSLRKAFPAELSGLYSTDEIQIQEAQPANGVEHSAGTAQITAENCSNVDLCATIINSSPTQMRRFELLSDWATLRYPDVFARVTVTEALKASGYAKWTSTINIRDLLVALTAYADTVADTIGEILPVR